MTTLDDFKRMLNEHPENTDTLLVLADWLSDHGDPLADGFHALGVLRRYPWRFNGTDSKCWGWIHPNWAKFGTQSQYNTLPDHWYDQIEATRHVIESLHRANSYNFHTLIENQRYGPFVLFKAAAKAFLKLPPDRRAELLIRPVLVLQ